MEDNYHLSSVKFAVIHGRKLLNLLKLHKKRCITNQLLR